MLPEAGSVVGWTGKTARSGSPWCDPGPAIEPDCHAGLEPRRALHIEAKTQRAAIVIAGGTLGLPGCERAERLKLGDKSRDRLVGIRRRDVDPRPHGEIAQIVLTHVE